MDSGLTCLQVIHEYFLFATGFTCFCDAVRHPPGRVRELEHLFPGGRALLLATEAKRIGSLFGFLLRVNPNEHKTV